MTTLPVELVSATITVLRAKYIAEGHAPSYFEINNGLCEDFAEELLERLCHVHGRREDLFTVCNENFYRQDDSDGWDFHLLMSYWGIRPPEHFTWKMLDGVDFGCHVWLTSGGLHYDAECPQGVDSFFELPLFKRCLVRNMRMRGIDCPNVETDDVQLAPQCPILLKAA